MTPPPGWLIFMPILLTSALLSRPQATGRVQNLAGSPPAFHFESSSDKVSWSELCLGILGCRTRVFFIVPSS